MNRIAPVLVAAGLAASGVAFAQNTPSNNGLTTGIAPGNSSGAVTPGIGPSAGPAEGPPVIGGANAGIAPNGTPPTMGNTAQGGGMAPGGATATRNGSQRHITSGLTNGGTNGANGAAAADASNTANQALVPGANSFTMGQARARMRQNGFTHVTDLHKDRRGIWRGKAMKDGQSVSVALDYQGHIVGGQPSGAPTLGDKP